MIPTLQFTGSPETCCNALLKNRIVILIDNTPISILIPASLLEMTENTNEINSFKRGIKAENLPFAHTKKPPCVGGFYVLCFSLNIF